MPNPTPNPTDRVHTPGPWCVGIPTPSRVPNGFDIPVFVGEFSNHGNTICTVHLGGEGATSAAVKDVEANALLIASATQLHADLASSQAQIATLEKERDEARSERDELNNWKNGFSKFFPTTEIDNLKAQLLRSNESVQVLRDALKFYGPEGDFDLGDYELKITEDSGDIARAALTQAASMHGVNFHEEEDGDERD